MANIDDKDPEFESVFRVLPDFDAEEGNPYTITVAQDAGRRYMAGHFRIEPPVHLGEGILEGLRKEGIKVTIMAVGRYSTYAHYKFTDKAEAPKTNEDKEAKIGCAMMELLGNLQHEANERAFFGYWKNYNARTKAANPDAGL